MASAKEEEEHFDDELYAGEEDIVLNESFDSVVIIDNLPCVSAEKYPKLCAVIRKIYGAFGNIVKDGLYLPMQAEDVEKRKTLGYAFVEYATFEEAKHAVVKGDNRKLDAKHKLRCNLLSDVETLAEMDMEYTAPKKSEFESKTNVTSWLLDETGRDQFVVRHGDATEVFWNDPLREATNSGRVLQYGGEREIARGKSWTESYVRWSPQGSHLATFHNQGIMLWGGEEFVNVGKFAHPNVMEMDFSPKENYLITTNFEDHTDTNPTPSIQIWDILTGKMMRGFDNPKKTWPAFQWSFDDKYLMRMSTVTKGGVKTECVSIYETPHMGLLNKQSIPLAGLKEAQWSPQQHIFAYYLPERGNKPSSIGLIELPSRKVIREKHLFKVTDAKMHWQQDGDFLCVETTRQKTKHSFFTSFEIFRMREKNIPIEVVELADSIVHFAWEAHGSRFAVIHGDKSKKTVSIYKLHRKKLKLVKDIATEKPNKLFWSPDGAYMVLGSLAPEGSNSLEFVDASNGTILAENDHYLVNNVEWDPSGRYVVTSVTQPIEAEWRMENGYKVWSSQGVLLAHVALDKCFQVLWRPRPACLLTLEQQKEVQATLKEKHWSTFQAEDDAIKNAHIIGAAKEREVSKQAWITYRIRVEEERLAEAGDRAAMRGGYGSDIEADMVDIDMEEVKEISSTTEVIS